MESLSMESLSIAEKFVNIEASGNGELVLERKLKSDVCVLNCSVPVNCAIANGVLLVRSKPSASKAVSSSEISYFSEHLYESGKSVSYYRRQIVFRDQGERDDASMIPAELEDLKYCKQWNLSVNVIQSISLSGAVKLLVNTDILNKLQLHINVSGSSELRFPESHHQFPESHHYSVNIASSGTAIVDLAQCLVQKLCVSVSGAGKIVGFLVREQLGVDLSGVSHVDGKVFPSCLIRKHLSGGSFLSLRQHKVS